MGLTVMVLFGGVSPEYAVSLQSAYAVIGALRTRGHRVLPVGITQEGLWRRFDGPDEAILSDTWHQEPLEQTSQPVRSPRAFIEAFYGCLPDCVFPAVHGVNCEDGALQGFLTLADLPYVGSQVLASAACMDKQHAKRVFRDAGLPQCAFTAITRQQIHEDLDGACQQVAQATGFPCFLKPSNGGSSIGTQRVDQVGELADALKAVSSYDPVVLAEAFIRAREIEVSVLGGSDPLVGALGEIVTDERAFTHYDYEAKYLSADGARVLVPAPLDEPTADLIRGYALRAYRSMGCTGMSRIDFFIDRDDGSVYLNEINTLPGFTTISVYPKSFAATGLAMDELVERLCLEALSTHQAARKRVTR